MHCVRFLVEQRSVEVNQQDLKRGWTPLMRVAHMAHHTELPFLAIFEYLLQQGADPSIIGQAITITGVVSRPMLTLMPFDTCAGLHAHAFLLHAAAVETHRMRDLGAGLFPYGHHWTASRMRTAAGDAGFADDSLAALHYAAARLLHGCCMAFSLTLSLMWVSGAAHPRQDSDSC